MNYSWLQAKKNKKNALSDTSTHTDGRCTAAFDWGGKQRKWAVFLEWMLLCFFSGCRSWVSVCACVSFPAVMLAKHTQVQKQGAHKCTFHIMLCAFMYIHVLYLRSEQTLWTHFVFGDSLAIPSSHLTCGISQLTYRNSWMACGCFDLKADLCVPVLF